MQKNKKGTILSIVVFIFGVLLPIFLWKTGNSFNLYFKPVIWILLLIMVVLFSKKRNRAYNFNKKAIFEISLMASLIYIISYYSLGLIIGYSKSPFDRSLIGILKNIWIFIPFIISREIIRDYIIKSTRKKTKFLIIFISITMIFSDIPYNTFSSYSSTLADIIEFSIKTFLPLTCLNIFLTYLCVRESYKSSLIYLIPIKIISLLTPVYPYNLFFITIIIELLIPFIVYTKIENLFNLVGILSIYKNNDVSSKIKKILFLSFLILMLLFTTRMLPISPIVILSNSMYPYIERGDIAIINKIDSSQIKINDIIEYRLDDIYVIHRVINIKNTSKGKTYITKGDNNKSKDSKPVYKEQINGKVVGFVPKVGYPTIWIREFLDRARGIKIREGDRL